MGGVAGGGGKKLEKLGGEKLGVMREKLGVGR